MGKVQYPPQGGEKYLCFTLFCTMLLSVISCVAIIYAIVIVYIPSKIELESTIDPNSKMCTTLSKSGNISGLEDCQGWSSCEEWCLSVSNKECSHVYAAVRNLGTEIDWINCEIPPENVTYSDEFINHKCNVLQDLPSLNCKLFPYEKDEDKNPGDKNRCIRFHNIQIACEAGICRNISSVYKSKFQSMLLDLEAKQPDSKSNKHGVCDCTLCPEELNRPYGNSCPSDVTNCLETPNKNETYKAYCDQLGCSTCKQICRERAQCYDLRRRKDPTEIGTDEFGNSVSRYYTCEHGFCSEIYDLKCERRCDGIVFNTTRKNSFIFQGEKVIMAYCRRRSTAKVSKLEGGARNTLLVACTNVTIDRSSNMMISRDCVNGTWFPNNYNGGSVNYSYLTTEYAKYREIEEFKVDGIDYEHDITFINRTKLKINIEGCVNTLSEECNSFYDNYGKDGRNYTSRAVYPCFYDPENYEFVVIDFNPSKVLLLLILFSTIPGGVMIISCIYMCGCSKFIYVGDDGHMRLSCCGKYVTGIGNVPKWDPPPRRLKEDENILKLEE
uniref:Uncharacterized protein n=1 Tax=Lepeophtheirus salmonis TaxID=72036 RepID=A0A0K2TXH1_LEPSM